MRSPVFTVWTSHAGLASIACTETTCNYAGACVDVAGGGRVECVCHFNCTPQAIAQRGDALDDAALLTLHNSIVYRQHGPLCGTNHRLYRSQCEMDEESCRQQLAIHVRHPVHACWTGAVASAVQHTHSFRRGHDAAAARAAHPLFDVVLRVLLGWGDAPHRTGGDGRLSGK